MKNCILCEMPLFKKPLMICDDMPAAAQNVPKFCDLPTDIGITLHLCQCSGCGLIQFDCEPVFYYRDVIRAGGFNSTMKELRRTQYRHFIELCDLHGKSIFEAGAGQGEFMQVLNEFDVRSYGIEHNAELVELAQNKGLNIDQFFFESVNERINGAPFDAFTSFNFLEHQPYPNVYLRAIYNNLGMNAFGLLTVPSFEYIIEQNRFYELIHDHIAYYTSDTLRFALEKNGFDVVEMSIINRDTHAAIIKKRKPNDISGLLNNTKRLKINIHAYIDLFLLNNKKVAIWGASHQGFTISSTMELGGKISYIIDSAPFKQGRFSPASHIPIVSPEHFFKDPVSSIIIIAPGYTNEIADIIWERFGSNIEIVALHMNKLEKLEAKK